MKTSRREVILGTLGALVFGPRLFTRFAVAGDDDPTEDNIEGPFYRPDAPFRSKLRTDEEGDALFVSGIVRGADGKPLSGAVVDVWQANQKGHYDNEDREHPSEKFKLRGRIKTGDDGRYEAETIVPGRYPIGDDSKYRPAHIHFKISAHGHAPLTTQLYFEGDPYLEKDPFVKKSLVKPLVRKEGKERGLEKPFFTVVFDIRLRKPAKATYR